MQPKIKGNQLREPLELTQVPTVDGVNLVLETQLGSPVGGGGGGGVDTAGTPVDNQVAVFTDADTIEGNTGLTFGGTTLEVAGTVQTSNTAGPQLVDIAASATTPTFIPDRADLDTGIGTNGGDRITMICGGLNTLQIENAGGREAIIVPNGTVLLPSITFFGDLNTGFYNSGADTIRATLNSGAGEWQFFETSFSAVGVTNGPALRHENPSSTNPTLLPDRTDADTGVGLAAADQLSLIAGSVEAARFSEASSAVIQTNQSNVGLTADIGSTQGDGPITSTYNVYSTVANPGDAATLPATFAVGTRIHIKNDGANSMDVFPASGDDAGAGVDTAVAVAAGDFAVFLATAADSTWTKIMGGTA